MSSLSDAQLDDLSVVASKDSTSTGGWVAIKQEQLRVLLNDSRVLTSIREECGHRFDSDRVCFYCLQRPDEDGPDGYEPGKSVWSEGGEP